MTSETVKDRAYTLEKFLAIPVIWNGTPHDFMTMVFLAERFINPMALPLSEQDKRNGVTEATVNTIAAFFQEVIIVDFYPYKDLEDLIENWEPSSWMINNCQKNLKKLRENTIIETGIKQTGTFLLPDPISGKSVLQFWVDAVATRLSQRFNVPQKEQYRMVLFTQLQTGDSNATPTHQQLIRFPFTWNGSPELFLELVTELENIAEPEKIIFTKTDRERKLSRPTTSNIAATLMNVTQVNLLPYRNFQDLITNGTKTKILLTNTLNFFENVIAPRMIKQFPVELDKDLTYIWADFFITSAGLDLKFTDSADLVKSLIMTLGGTNSIGVVKNISEAQLNKMMAQYDPFH